MRNPYIVVYTADDEEPNCGRCDHICSPEAFCEKFCGPEHGWNRYERSVEKEKFKEGYSEECFCIEF